MVSPRRIAIASAVLIAFGVCVHVAVERSVDHSIEEANDPRSSNELEARPAETASSAAVGMETLPEAMRRAQINTGLDPNAIPRLISGRVLGLAPEHAAGASIRIELIDANGFLLPIRLTPPWSIADARSGRFTLDTNVFHSATITARVSLRVMHAAYASSRVLRSLSDLDRWDPIEIRVSRHASIIGRALDQNGEPVPGTTVYLLELDRDEPRTHAVSGNVPDPVRVGLDASGRFVAHVVDGARFGVLAVAPHYRHAYAQVTAHPHEEMNAGTLTLREGRRIHVTYSAHRKVIEASSVRLVRKALASKAVFRHVDRAYAWMDGVPVEFERFGSVPTLNADIRERAGSENVSYAFTVAGLEDDVWSIDIEHAHAATAPTLQTLPDRQTAVLRGRELLVLESDFRVDIKMPPFFALERRAYVHPSCRIETTADLRHRDATVVLAPVCATVNVSAVPSHLPWEPRPIHIEARTTDMTLARGVDAVTLVVPPRAVIDIHADVSDGAPVRRRVTAPAEGEQSNVILEPSPQLSTTGVLIDLRWINGERLSTARIHVTTHGFPDARMFFNSGHLVASQEGDPIRVPLIPGIETRIAVTPYQTHP